MKIFKKILDIFNIKYFYLKIVELSTKILKRTIIKKISKDIFIFGGDNFIGNTKYLYLYLSRHSNYRLIWISRNNETVVNLKKKGFEVYNKFSIKSLLLSLKAKYIFVTHGFNEILPIELSIETKLIYLAHGNPFKKPVFDAKNFRTIFSTKYDYDLMIKLLVRMDYHISCSDNFNEILKKAYKIKISKIFTTGYPRNDLLFCKENQFIINLKKKINISNDIKQIFLYAPTFRENKRAHFPLSEELLNDLNNYLEENHSILILKPHSLEEVIDYKNLKNIRIAPQNQDIQELLLISDALITDYSSVFLDYILTKNPIIFFAYDLDFYRNTRGDLYFDYESFVPGPIAKTGAELIELIKTISNWSLNYKEKIEEILYFSHKYVDGNSCQRVCNLLQLKINSK